MAVGMAVVRGLHLPSNSGQHLLPSRKPVSSSACTGIQHCMHGPQRSACSWGPSCSCNGHSTSSTARKCLRLTPFLQQCSRRNLDIGGSPPPLCACTGRSALSYEGKILHQPCSAALESRQSHTSSTLFGLKYVPSGQVWPSARRALTSSKLSFSLSEGSVDCWRRPS